MNPLINLTENDPDYDYASVKPVMRQSRPAHLAQAEALWRLRDKIVDYRADRCHPDDLEAAILGVVLYRMEKAACACERGDMEQAMTWLLDAKAIATTEALADALEVWANQLAGHPLECNCVLPEQSCPLCRHAIGATDGK